MRKKLILIDFFFLGLAVFLGYQLKARWVSFQVEHNLSLLNQKNEPRGSPQKSPAKPLNVPNYTAAVDNHLFNVERNNVIPVDPPALPPPPKVSEPKPVLMGTVELGGEEYALMLSANKNANRQYRQVKVGESLDGYTLVKILDQKVLMSAAGAEVEVRLNEPSQLVARDFVPSPNNSERSISIGSVPGSQGFDSINSNPTIPESSTPVGTVRDGRRKKVVPSPFGPMEIWEDVK
jgi:hypothetical protein